ncbi:hypothetical protein D3C73_1554920 [compost metagenome]
MNEHGATRHKAPADHDSGDSDPGTQTFHQQIAGYLTAHVTEEKDTRPQAVDRVGETQVGFHM